MVSLQGQVWRSRQLHIIVVYHLVVSEALNLPVLVLTFGLNEVLIIFQCLVGITQIVLTRRPYSTIIKIINPS